MINIWRVRIVVLVLLCVPVTQGFAAHSENDLLDQLRADYVALTGARAEFEQLEKSARTAEQEDYAAWIRQLGEQFADSCRKFSINSVQSIPDDIPCTEFTSAYDAPVQIDTDNESTDSEKTAAMVGQFNESLGEFDEKLLREQDRVKAARPRTASSGSGGGGASGESGDGSDGESGQTAAAGGGAQEGRQPDQQGADGEAGSEQPVAGARGRSSGGNQSSAPDDIPDGSDDDVIARQLREAAEKETDPELKKKLWEEYRRYKNG